MAIDLHSTSPTYPLIPEESKDLLFKSGLSPLKIKGHMILPIVQGGMGVGVSAHRLAGSVSSMGGMGTISSIDLRRLHPDLMEYTRERENEIEGELKARINQANLTAISREIKQARAISKGSGLLAINVMRAVSEYEPYIKKSLEEGIDAVVVGAGLPLDLPEIAKDFPNTALIPILSDARGAALILRKWEKKGRMPDAIVLEHPRLAGGHLGAAKIEDLKDPKFDFENSVPELLQFMESMGVAHQIPIIAAGGISTKAHIKHLQGLGVSGVQMGTAFAVTKEGDADRIFKEILTQARPEDLIEFTSVAGLPARAVKTPWLEKYLRNEHKLKAIAHKKKQCTMRFDCLQQCGLRDGDTKVGQFCIDKHLGFALVGDRAKGLFFRGAGKLPFGEQIRSVKDLINYMLSGLEIDDVVPAY
jgi:nitronate monooxygenase